MHSGKWARSIPGAVALIATLSAIGSIARAQCSPGSFFSPAGGTATGSLPRYVVASTFDGDGVLDLAIANSASGANSITIQLGNGDGTFHPGGVLDAGGRALGLATGDFNGDGIRDLAVAHGAGGTISVLLGLGSGGAGDGTFAAPASYELGTGPDQLAAGDFNGDDLDDLAIADPATSAIYLLLGQAAGPLTAGSSFVLGFGPAGTAAAADLSSDGILDLVVVATAGRIAVLLGGGSAGAGDGSFEPPVYYVAGPSPSDLAVLDLNSDGKLDVAISNRVRGGIYTFSGLGGGALGAPGAFAQGLSLSSVGAAQVDDDGFADLLTTSSPGDQLVLLRGRAATGIGVAFEAPTVEGALGPTPSDLLVGDFNGDCLNDAAVVSTNGSVDPPTTLSTFLGSCPRAPGVDPPSTFVGGDRPGDEGGFARLSWHRSVLDNGRCGTVTSYQVWRQEPGAGSMRSGLATDGAQVAEVAAVGVLEYTVDVPTTRDSVSGDIADHAFFVRAVTSDPLVYYDSETLVLHSVDNLPPPGPQYVRAQPTPGGAIWVHWAPVAVADFLEYRLHRGESPIFVPGPDNLIAALSDTQYVDAVGPATSTYKVLALDVHGNASPTAGGATVLCAPPSCSFSASYPTMTASFATTAHDTTFVSVYHDQFRSAYDVVEGWALSSVWGEVGISMDTNTNDTYWIEGAPIDQAFSFAASLHVEQQTTQNCGIHCASGYVQASVAEAGVPASPCPGASEPCVVVTRRGYEPFKLSISTKAGVFGSVYAASATVKATLRISGLPPGAYLTSCSGYISDPATPVQLSVVRAGLEGGFPRITWYSADGGAARATVYRRTTDTDWLRQDEVVADGSGYLAFEDHSALPGNRYGYRLGVFDEGEERPFGEVWVDVPAAARLALAEVSPNPATGPIEVGFSLPAARPAWLEVFDVGGRRLHAREVGVLGAGPHTLRLDESGALRPGIYLLRLSQGGAFVSRRVVKIL